MGAKVGRRNLHCNTAPLSPQGGHPDERQLLFPVFHISRPGMLLPCLSSRADSVDSALCRGGVRVSAEALGWGLACGEDAEADEADCP